MKTSENGIKFIAEHEGLRLTAYRCPANVLTIGYGHTGKDVTPGLKITKEKAIELLKSDIAWAEDCVKKNLPNLNQNQFDSLVSFIFNVGTKNFQDSTLLKKAKVNPNDTSISIEFAKYNKAKQNGVLAPLAGLTKRRKDESNLYFSK